MIRRSLAQGRNGQTEYTSTLPTEGVYQVRCVHADGALGETDFYVLIFRDISESRRIDRMRTDFVANASHELRTPLASLRGFIETLLGPARNDPKAHERFLTIMLEQVTRMSRLVDDLMSLSRLELKARLAPEEQVDLVPLIGSVCDALAPLAADVNVVISQDLPDHPVIVAGNRDELTQVFENLIENACKYGQEGKASMSCWKKTGRGHRGQRHRSWAGHSGRSRSAPDGTLLPRQCRKQPDQKRHRIGPGNRQAHSHPTPGAADHPFRNRQGQHLYSAFLT
jgi:signal transduction histidine kinase